MRCTQLKHLVVLLLAAGCSDSVAEPAALTPAPELPQARPLLSALIVTEAQALDLSAAWAQAASGQVAWVALSPGSLPHIAALRIRNLAVGDAIVDIPVIGGGFDPVAIAAAAGDELELTLRHSSGARSTAYARVPAKRPPVIVRTYPTKGRTDVALGVLPTVVFSEPVQPQTAAAGVRLLRDGEPIQAEVRLLAGQPWAAQVSPAEPLEPGTAYQLIVTRAVADLEGDSLEAAITVPFSTQSAEPPAGPPATPLTIAGMAFLRNSDVTVANGDASGAVPVPLAACQEKAGHAWLHTPRLSPDQKRLLLSAGGMSPDGTCVIGVDGSDALFLSAIYDAKWSPDGANILWYDEQGFRTARNDGTNRRFLLGQDALPGAGPRAPGEYRSLGFAWLPDGTIGFLWNGGIWRMAADGSGIKQVGSYSLDLQVHSVSWSPDGSRIAFVGPRDVSATFLGSMAADGSDVQIHLRTEDVSIAAPEWSPDGRSIAFNTSGPYSRIHVVDVQTGAVRQLVPEVSPARGSTYYDWAISWVHQE